MKKSRNNTRNDKVIIGSPSKLPSENTKVEKLEQIGEGSYGIVYRGYIRKFEEKIVLKRNTLNDAVDFFGSIREMDILMKLSEHPNIVNFKGLVAHNEVKHLFGNLERDRYKDDTHHFIFENGICDLLQLIETESLSFDEIMLFITDILNGLAHIHANGYLHRDIKIENLLLFGPNPNEINRRHIKICDFGLSKPIVEYGKNSKTYRNTPRIVTAWYRSPDICIGNTEYNQDVDIWSLGIGILEILGNSICKNCRDDVNQLIGTLFSSLPNDCFDSNNQYEEYKHLSVKRGIGKAEFLKTLNLETTDTKKEELYDLLVKMLKINPKERITAKSALDYPIFRDLKLKSPQHKKLVEKKIQIVGSEARHRIMSMIFMIYNEKKDIFWYKHRIIFQSISFIDRYLAYCHTRKMDVNTDPDIALKYLVCLYLSIKYFVTIEPIFSFSDFIDPEYCNERSLKLASIFETFLISEIFKYDIYQETVFEKLTSDNLEVDVRDFLLEYGRIENFEGSVDELVVKIRDVISKK